MCAPHDYETEDLSEYGRLTVDDLDDLRPASEREGDGEEERERAIPTADD